MSTCKLETVKKFALLYDIFYHLILLLEESILLFGFEFEYEFLDVSDMYARFSECRSDISLKIYINTCNYTGFIYYIVWGGKVNPDLPVCSPR